MIAFLSGTLLDRDFGVCVIDVNGVGYEVAVSLATFDKLPLPGNPVKLHIYTAVREDAITLFGFADVTEKQLFKALLGVSGIGGKLALNVLGSMPATNICAAIEAGDVKMLSRINGIGKRTAERMIVELKGKLSNLSGGEKVTTTATADNNAISDAMLALEQLGYKHDVVCRAVNTVIDENPDTKFTSEDLLRAALKKITF